MPGLVIPTRFCVLTTQRSGSTWLRDLLDSHPDIICFGELFYSKRARLTDPHIQPYHLQRAEIGGRRPRVVWNYLKRLETHPHAKRAVGFKLMYGQLAQFPEILPRLILGRYTIIHLVRENLLDVVLSEHRAARTGLAHTTQAVEQVAVKLNVVELHRRLVFLSRCMSMTRWALRALPLDFRELSYEQLTTNPQAALESVMQQLGILSDGVCFRSERQKISSGDYRGKIENYDEVHRALAGTAFEDLLQSGRSS